MPRHVKKTSFSDSVLWYGALAGGVCMLLSAVPMVPWRYARTDTNIGNRFVMDRYYNLFGATDQFGKSLNWFTLKKKIQKKAEEFGRPSPVSALVGTVGREMGTGGAAIGCSVWQACKDHTNQRYVEYWKVAVCGITSFVSLLLGALCCCLAVLWMSWEEDGSHRKKKKKSDEFTPQAKTMMCCIGAFLLSFVGVGVFLYQLGATLNQFKTTAYFPYATSHLGPYIAGVGSLILLICMLISICRLPSKNNPEWQGAPMMNAGPSGQKGGYGGYPPSGAYAGEGAGYPSGAYTGEGAGYPPPNPYGYGPQQQQW